MLRPITPLNVGDYVVDIHGAYGQITSYSNLPLIDELFEVEWSDRGNSRRVVGSVSYEHRADIFFVKTL